VGRNRGQGLLVTSSFRTSARQGRGTQEKGERLRKPGGSILEGGKRFFESKPYRVYEIFLGGLSESRDGTVGKKRQARDNREKKVLGKSPPVFTGRGRAVKECKKIHKAEGI